MSKLKRKNYKNCTLTRKQIEEVLRIELDLSDSERGEDDSIDDPTSNIDNNEVSELEDNLEFIEEEGDDDVPIEDTNLEVEEEAGSNTYTSKSGKLWQRTCLIRGRRAMHNIVTQPPGLTAYSTAATTILEIFELFERKM
ncbi:hypothetical protein QE152_g22550 [Popillia japonica]|uniref:Uncharacterized protein n=1 Tax=Popillia japonica TaxID=7064 RepID=A0AAW1KLU0_POPJA